MNWQWLLRPNLEADLLNTNPRMKVFKMNATVKTSPIVKRLPVWGLCTTALFSIFLGSLAYSQEEKKQSSFPEKTCAESPQVSEQLLYLQLGTHCSAYHLKEVGSMEAAALEEKVHAIVDALEIPRSIVLKPTSLEDGTCELQALSAIEKAKLTEWRLEKLRGTRAAGFYRLGSEMFAFGRLWRKMF
jgi:hypothetical protein